MEKKKYYVKLVETHEIRVEADSEEKAIEIAKKQSGLDNRTSTDGEIAIAA